jgi:shikimate dehydrogenase
LPWKNKELKNDMKKYGLIGYPLTHSFSKRFFTEKFETENIESSYDNFEIDSIQKFPEIIRNNPKLIGLNVTIPYKEQVIPFLNELNDSAQKIGAVNTVKITRTSTGVYLKGFNTDTFGFENSIKPLLKEYHKKALILGTGGASKALKFVLNKLGIEFISASIEELKDNEIRYDEVDEKMMAERLLIINATPLGTYPKTESFPAIPYEFITEKHLLFDLVYNPEVTQFMAKGKARGATVKNGYEMLLGQALRSYEIWNNEE